MMRRIMVLLLGLLLVVSGAVSAQDNNPLLNLDAVYSVPALGLQLQYPQGWLTKSRSTAIFMAENKADMGALLDGDSDTQPEDYTMSVNWVELGSSGIPMDVKLDDLVDTLAKQQGIVESSPRLEVSVMSYRAISIVGTNPNSKTGFATLWLQDGYVVILSIGLPVNTATSRASLDLILSGITPLNPLELGSEPLISPDGDFSMRYPADWFKGVENQLAEFEKDLETGDNDVKGIATVIVEEPLDFFGEDVKDMTSLVEFVKRLFGSGTNEEITTSEHILLGQPAITLTGHYNSSEVRWMAITVFILEDKIVLLGTVFPTEARFEAFQPTYLAMLQSIAPVEQES